MQHTEKMGFVVSRAFVAALALLLLVAGSGAQSPGPAPAGFGAAPARSPGPAPAGFRAAPAPARRVGRPASAPTPAPAPAARSVPRPSPAPVPARPPTPAPAARRPPFHAVTTGYLQRHYPMDSSSDAYRALVVAFEGENPFMEWVRSGSVYSWDDVLWLYEWHTPCARVERTARRFANAEGFAYSHASEVLPGLWIGSACAAADPLWLADRQIGFVLNAAREHERSLLPAAWRERVDYHKVQLEDRWVYTTRQFLDDLDAAVARLSAWRRAHPDGSVLVHCNLGISRSTSVVLRYLQRVHGMSVGEALALVQRARPFARPNQKFQSALGLPTADRIDLKRR